MYYKQYGNTDMRVSAIGMGTMRYDDDDVRAIINAQRSFYMHMKKE